MESESKANELIGRDTDNDSTDDYTPAYDEAGNMTDDDQYNTYEYDVFSGNCPYYSDGLISGGVPTQSASAICIPLRDKHEC